MHVPFTVNGSFRSSLTPLSMLPSHAQSPTPNDNSPTNRQCLECSQSMEADAGHRHHSSALWRMRTTIPQSAVPNPKRCPPYQSTIISIPTTWRNKGRTRYQLTAIPSHRHSRRPLPLKSYRYKWCTLRLTLASETPSHQQKGRPLTLPESTMYGYICVQMCCFGGIYGHVLTHTWQRSHSMTGKIQLVAGCMKVKLSGHKSLWTR